MHPARVILTVTALTGLMIGWALASMWHGVVG
jgi:hypothetical protein